MIYFNVNIFNQVCLHSYLYFIIYINLEVVILYKLRKNIYIKIKNYIIIIILKNLVNWGDLLFMQAINTPLKIH
jgi:hypothetical protein